MNNLNKFMGRMIVNYLNNMDACKDGPFFMRHMRHYCGSVYSIRFINLFDELEEAAKKAKGKDDVWVSVMDFIHMEEFKRLKELFIEDMKQYSEEFTVFPSVKFLSGMLDLTEEETMIMQFYHLLSGSDVDYYMREMISEIQSKNEQPAQFFSRTFNFDQANLEKILSSEKNIFSCGLLEPHQTVKNHYKIIPTLQELLGPDAILTDDIIEQRLFPNTLDSDLDLDYYHQQEDIGIATDVIERGMEDRLKGINVLMWGLPGMGKTELAVLLAKLRGWELKVIGDIGNTDNKEKARNERLLALNIAQRLFRVASETRKVVLLFDEMEDLFKMDMNATQSKAFINRIIEKTPVPIIWTTNDMHSLGSAVLRRMTFNIPFNKVPPAKAREAIWRKYVKRYNVNISDKTITDLARNFDVVPALIANITKVAHLSRLDETQIPRVLTNLDTAMHCGEERKFNDFSVTTGKAFKIEFVNTNRDLVQLSDRILTTGRKKFSILSYGPSGTGKSAYGVHLAETLGMKYRIKKASDLLSMWVGGTERNIAMMFEEAKDDDLFLILDEADSFFQNRGNAQRSWEVTEVNEMLVQMEKHNGPFLCTTNLESSIDPAAFRRFTFKVKYDYLKEEQRGEIFRYYFDREPPAALKTMDQLAPGDFANVFDKMTFLGAIDTDEIMELLTEECEVKPTYKRKLGF